jgi:lysozyme
MATISRQPVIHLIITAILTGSIAMYESYRPDAYIPIAGDVPTVGFGTTVHPDGKPVVLGEKVTRSQAESYLAQDLDKFKQGMVKCIKAPLYQNEFDAYLSLTYNIGTSSFCSSSIPLKLSKGDYYGACSTILQYNKMKDTSKPRVKNPRTGQMQYQYKVIKGLDNRRKAEYKTCVGSTGGAT